MLPIDPKSGIVPNCWAMIYQTMREHDCLYSGDIQRITNFYAGILSGFTPNGKFWSRDLYNNRRNLTHVPIASDISSTSSNLLFSEPPKINALDKTSQDRLLEITDDNNLNALLLQAAEISSALGGIYLKLNWDKELVNYPIISIAQPDQAYFFTNLGIITEIILVKEIAEESNKYYRLLEQHLKGVITYTLWQGTQDTIGFQVPLTYFDDTKTLPPIIETGLDTLACWYIPNMLPNRNYRGSYTGQSDYAGSESLMDSLDEVYTSLVRDIRLGKGRLTVPESFLEKDSYTGMLSMNVEQEVYSPLRMPADADNTITISQFAIRTQEHVDTANLIMKTILSNAGYAPQTFGLDISGQAESGTALTIRERKSLLTTAKKAEYWKEPLEELLEAALIVDYLHLGNKNYISDVVVEIQDSVKGDLTTLADSVMKLSSAQAASKDTLIRLLHPDWTDEQVDAEKRALLEESGIVMPDLQVNNEQMLGEADNHDEVDDEEFYNMVI